MGKVIGIVAIKGGVGKTTISASLASDLATACKKKVLLIDANYSAPNLALHMDILEPEHTIHEVLAGTTRLTSAVHTRYGVDVVPGDLAYDRRINPLRLHDRLHAIRSKYDFVIIDSSPSLNDEVLSTLIASDILFVVSTPDYPTLSCSLRAAKLAKQRGKPIAGILLNKIRDPHYELTTPDIEESTGISVVACLRDDLANGRALYSRIPTSLYAPRARFSREIHKLALTISGSSEPTPFLRKFLGKGFRREEVNRQLLKQNFYSELFTP